MSAQLKEIERLDLALRQANQRLDAAEKEAAVANGKATEYVPCRTLFFAFFVFVFVFLCAILLLPFCISCGFAFVAF